MKQISSIKELLEIESRLEHLENLALWMARETSATDQTLSQTSTLISVVVEDLRERILDLVKSLEEKIKEFEKVIQ
ncbi:MAG: hypothetical protein NZO16_02280 [Deltaproteobacteria bacterium]|nr:hypothetical protein [Deltaproteobacteria bacterium]